MTTVTPHAQARATVLYDGDCGFCKWSLAKLLAWDRRGALRPLPLQDLSLIHISEPTRPY